MEEAQLTLEDKDKELDRAAKGHEKGMVSNEELDRAKLDVSLARIKLERSKLDLDDAQAKFQIFTTSSISLTAAQLVHGRDGLRTNQFSRSFSVRGRERHTKAIAGPGA